MLASAAFAVFAVLAGAAPAGAATTTYTAPYPEASAPTLQTKDPAGHGDSAASASASAATGAISGAAWAEGWNPEGGRHENAYQGPGYNFAYAGGLMLDRLPAAGPGTFAVSVEISLESFTNWQVTGTSPIAPPHSLVNSHKGFADVIAQGTLWYHRCPPPGDCFPASYAAGEVARPATWVANTAYPWVTINAPATVRVDGCVSTPWLGDGQVRVLVGLEARAVAQGTGEARASFEGARIERISMEPVVQCPAPGGPAPDTGPPDTSITSGPSNPSSSTDATFQLSSSKGGNAFECALDGAEFAPCTSPHTERRLTRGIHEIRVKAVDGMGQQDATPASFSWQVDADPPPEPDVTAPAVTLLTPGDGTYVRGSLVARGGTANVVGPITVEARARDDGSGITERRFQVDGVPVDPSAVTYQPATGVYSFRWVPSEPGRHVISAVARNGAGLTGAASREVVAAPA